jgi:ABC-type phosphate transport system substrate-binding protein
MFEVPGFPIGLALIFFVLTAGVLYLVNHHGPVSRGITGRGAPRQYTLARGLYVGILVLTSALVTAVLVPSRLTLPEGVTCVTGSLELLGSTAFAGAGNSMVAAYEGLCKKVTVGQPNEEGSLDGLTQLSHTGPGGAGGVIALSDVPDPQARTALHKVPAAIVIYTIVVNPHTGVSSLNYDQLKKIFSGAYSNWDQVGGNDVPIRVVSRNAGSGTKLVFDDKILGYPEPAASSDDCSTRRPGATAAVLRCETPTTDALLYEVSKVPGAIGYADVASAKSAASPQSLSQGTGVNLVDISGIPATISAITRGHDIYRFYTTEYLYSYGPAAPGSPSAAFENFARNSPLARDIIRANGAIPCADQPVLCGQS